MCETGLEAYGNASIQAYTRPAITMLIDAIMWEVLIGFTVIFRI